MKRAIAALSLAMFVAGAPATEGEPLPDPAAFTAEDARRIIERVDREMQALTASGAERSDLASARLAASGVNGNDPAADVARIRTELDAVAGDMLGRDAIQDLIQTRLVPGGGLDPTAGMTYDSGPEGLLWAFWATDAPGIAPLAQQLAAAQAARPQLRIHDLHVMRLTDWRDLLQLMARLRDELERDDPLIDNEREALTKRTAVGLHFPGYLAAAQMAQTRRDGGHLLIEDMTAALAWSVRHIPSFVYVSPRGVVHRIKGIHPDRPLTAWLAQCQAWEQQHADLLNDRMRAP